MRSLSGSSVSPVMRDNESAAAIRTSGEESPIAFRRAGTTASAAGPTCPNSRAARWRTSGFFSPSKKCSGVITSLGTAVDLPQTLHRKQTKFGSRIVGECSQRIRRRFGFAAYFGQRPQGNARHVHIHGHSGQVISVRSPRSLSVRIAPSRPSTWEPFDGSASSAAESNGGRAVAASCEIDHSRRRSNRQYPISVVPATVLAATSAHLKRQARFGRMLQPPSLARTSNVGSSSAAVSAAVVGFAAGPTPPIAAAADARCA